MKHSFYVAVLVAVLGGLLPAVTTAAEPVNAPAAVPAQ